MPRTKIGPFEEASKNLIKFIENMEFLDSISKIPELIREVEKLEGHEKKVCLEIINVTMMNLSELLENKGHKWN